MYTGTFNQGAKNSCGAAVLAIAAHQLGKIATVDDPTVNGLYDQVSDPEFSKLLGITNPDLYQSLPSKIIEAAHKIGLKATLYEKKDINAGVLPSQVQGFKVNYVDALKPASIDTPGLKVLLTDKTYLQLLVYLDGNKTSMHWVLLQTDGKSYEIFDTAFGKAYPIDGKTLTVDQLLGFNAQFATERQNNFYGIAILYSL